MTNTYHEKMARAEALMVQASNMREEAEQLHLESVASTGDLKSWLGYHFESSSGLTEPFALFAKAYRRHLKALDGYTMVSFSRGHFGVSAFLLNTHTNKMVYVSTSDVRYSPDAWYNNILIRTAQHEKDYTGGANNWCNLPELKAYADRLTQ